MLGILDNSYATLPCRALISIWIMVITNYQVKNSRFKNLSNENYMVIVIYGLIMYGIRNIFMYFKTFKSLSQCLDNYLLYKTHVQ